MLTTRHILNIDGLMKLLNNSTIKLCYTLPILPVSERIINIPYTLTSGKCITEQIKIPQS